MSDPDLFLIAGLPGFSPQLGRLVSMMNYVRSTTIAAVAGLGVDELDYLHDSRSNSIGALLLHINYFKWFHVLSHEVNHRGQIRWLRTRATSRG
jgi:uncharacterized damage-inducible protein DinB